MLTLSHNGTVFISSRFEFIFNRKVKKLLGIYYGGKLLKQGCLSMCGDVFEIKPFDYFKDDTIEFYKFKY